MKKFFLILASLLIIGYIVFSALYFKNTSRNQTCAAFEVNIKDSIEKQFVKASDITAVIKNKKLYPVGKSFAEINTLAIRDTILTNKLVKSAEVYTTSKGAIVANVYQKEPILRIISDTKGSFYIDNNREKMPISPSFSVYVPLATGAIDENFAKNKLFDFAVFLNDNPNWNAWVEQIVVKPNKEVELIPRLGDFKIVLGDLDDYPAKLAKFTLFIEKGLNVVGWNRYSEINLKYENQVVCTRR